jgi:hypothetical protein
MSDQEKVQCPDCDALGRRDFLTLMGGTAVTLAGLELVPQMAAAQPGAAQPAPTAPRTKPAEAMIRELFESLTDAQKNQVVMPFNHRIGNSQTPARLGMYNASINANNIGVVYTRAQKELNERILKSICADDEGFRRVTRNGTFDNSRTLDNCGAHIFGNPMNNQQYAWVFTSHHLTVRCDGNSEPNTGFGGPMYYGHSTDGMSARNVWFFQTQQVLNLWDALSETQRRQATMQTYVNPQEQAGSIRHRPAPYPGLRFADMSADQKLLCQTVMRNLLAPFRREDGDEVMDIVRRNGGMDQIHFGFYRDAQTPEGRWKFWRLEGPGFVWNYRIHDHVHCFVNIAVPPRA